jgi:hypothetical protein
VRSHPSTGRSELSLLEPHQRGGELTGPVYTSSSSARRSISASAERPASTKKEALRSWEGGGVHGSERPRAASVRPDRLSGAVRPAGLLVLHRHGFSAGALVAAIFGKPDDLGHERTNAIGAWQLGVIGSWVTRPSTSPFLRAIAYDGASPFE